MEIIYTAAATASGGRDGKVTSSDGVLNLDLRIPAAMGGSGGAYTNPEQLFAAGYAACFDGALLLVAKTAKLPAGDTRVTAEVGFGKEDGGGFGLEITLHVHIPGVDMETARLLAAKAHEICPFSNATRGNVDVNLEVTI
ncbi:peroxiredoxin, Ohr subfamily [Filimonas lacunae]|uniref:Peroxiredoxin, Ohr subfamily n=1 Tax=Filimonas lacunae TaxID=477680 RepID=A0A173MRN8_9BACT|nr:organic hydroperoxide resistance protein [Filimonas lacunae]BAV10008.1 organic hydroperoxide resistance protein [Filimonas lacunae]SIS82474.1 peroxiredoxin, Ohr subfamily [Filimonas lacunae]